MQIKGIILGILMLGYFFIVGFLPYILGIIMSVIIIFLIRKKIIEKAPEFIRKVYIKVIVICECISIILTPLWYKYASERPNDTYVKMQEINENQSLIGLSKEQVIELLGEPYGNKEADIYYYDAGKITNYITGGTNDFYDLEITFDENGKVKSTSIELIA